MCTLNYNLKKMCIWEGKGAFWNLKLTLRSALLKKYNNNQEKCYLNKENTWKIPVILFSKMCRDHVLYVIYNTVLLTTIGHWSVKIHIHAETWYQLTKHSPNSCTILADPIKGPMKWWQLLIRKQLFSI